MNKLEKKFKYIKKKNLYSIFYVYFINSIQDLQYFEIK